MTRLISYVCNANCKCERDGLLVMT
uniref:Uncharacterized protein n=1 Tax=Arundo donax TaxID=35708 RepID=A0A0A9GQP0_ARUDO